MDKIQWNKSLSVGIPLIDEQHKIWIGRVSDLAEAIAARQGADAIGRTLGFLVNYTNYHFSTEERHMEEQGYPELAEHRRKHGELRQTLSNLVQDFEEEGSTQALAEFARNFLDHWLTGHIQEVDIKFGEFLKSKGIELPAET
jgi:hemerythrin